MTTHLENLEKSGNFREKSGETEIFIVQCNFYVDSYFSFILVSFNVSFCSCFGHSSLSVES